MGETDSEEVVPASRVGRAWVDYFTWGHIAMGLGFFTVGYLIVSLFAPVFASCAALLIAAITGWLWEVFENNLMWSWGMKFEDRKDSINNLLGDEMWVMFGAILMWIVSIIVLEVETAFWWFYVICAVGLLICLIGFFSSKAYHEKHGT